MQTEELLSPPQTPWWNAFGSQPLTTESLSGDASDSLAEVKADTPETEQGVVDKQSSTTLLTFSPGGKKSSQDVPKPHVAFTMQAACFEFGFARPVIYTKHPHVEQYYGVLSAYGPQRSSGRVMLPLKMETEEDGTIYVNAKQYHGIIRRRLSRAKAEKLSRCRKPYIHHSRHLHAMRRPRGSGGRFLNTKKVDATKPSNSQSSEVFHPENRTMNSSREANMPNLSGSEVTSMDYFLSSSVYTPSGMVMPIKWNAATVDTGCYNLNT
ncbi:PREDICTED: nuclear transcription factor Y subunit A-10-like [Camelina sativa]|uniref:Nuclear transcription factor Y subunit n=1 Tax=Camelina sativa TaxID=90675 RepID=A0ABM0V8M2_CAMSA|nr:PREDICTED: nuclear transcription factor Y subunit A-10-like [Camelina sativa]XP_010452584.1 PREDICTED: nuclear transcription factor Y subunit A-10-like [Camelina sativa]